MIVELGDPVRFVGRAPPTASLTCPSRRPLRLDIRWDERQFTGLRSERHDVVRPREFVE
jgi:hypothetical protein